MQYIIQTLLLSGNPKILGKFEPSTLGLYQVVIVYSDELLLKRRGALSRIHELKNHVERIYGLRVLKL